MGIHLPEKHSTYSKQIGFHQRMIGPQEFIRKIFSAKSLQLFLDYDGTLAEFAPTPDDVLPDNELIGLLEKLIKHPSIEPAVISGRSLIHIQNLVPLSGIWLAGSYGLELKSPTGETIHQTNYEQIRPVLEEIKPKWQKLIMSTPGIYLEDKDWSLALHLKNIKSSQAEQIIMKAKQNIKSINYEKAGFQLLGGYKFLEIAPKLAHKGDAVEYLLAQNYSIGALPVFIGDDDKDELAFEAVQQHNGVAIKVNPEPIKTIAQLRLENPGEVRNFLSSLLQKRSYFPG